jgi:Ala-tRNA(Pro) deacylase
MPVRKLKDFLDKHEIKYVSVVHSPAYTAQEIASRAHIKGRRRAKTVMVKIDGKMAMAVLPASSKVDFDYFRKEISAGSIGLASEEEFQGRFPDCEVGAMPPFGNLYGMEVYVDQGMAGDEEIAFSAGTHTELIKLPFIDFKRLVKPRSVRLS